jgi:hypothetical protein
MWVESWFLLFFALHPLTNSPLATAILFTSMPHRNPPMKYILLALLLSTVLALGQTANQWEIRKFTTSGMTSFWITGENSKAFGLNGSGVPAMIRWAGLRHWRVSVMSLCRA